MSTASNTPSRSARWARPSFQKRLSRTSFKQIAGAAHGFQVRGVFGIGLYLLTQSPDIHVHAARGHKALRSPNSVKQLVAGKHAVRARGQVVKQTKLERAQRERFALAGHAVGGG